MMKNEEKIVRIFRWIARIGSGITIVFMFVGSIIGSAVGGTDAEGIQPLLHLTARESAFMFAFGTMWLGLVLGWKWELVGGLLATGGMIAFYLFGYLFLGELPRDPFFFVLAFPGVLFLYCGIKTRSFQNGTNLAK